MRETSPQGLPVQDDRWTTMSDSTKSPTAVEADGRNGRVRYVGRRQGLSSYPKLKPSGMEWPSCVPEHWTVKRLKYVARRPIENGISEAGIYDDPEWPRYIRITDIKTPRSLRHDTFRSLPPEKAAQALVDPYDILLARVGEPGKSYLHVPREGTRACFAGYLVRYSPDAEHVVPDFVAYWTESHVYWACVRSRVIQTTIQNFSARRYKNLPMPLPPLMEQKAMVLYLDQETAKIDALIAKNDVLIERLKERRSALISRTVTRGLPPDESRKAGIDPHPKLKSSGVEWLGDMPDHWRVAPLCRVTTDIRASNVDKHIRSNEIAVKLCNYVDVYYNESIDSQVTYMHGSATGRQIDIFQLREGDVLITKDSEVQDDIGVPALVVEHLPNLVAGYHLVLVRPDLQCLYGPYLFRALQSDIASLQFTHCAQGVTRYGMTYPGIRSVCLPIPPLMEQQAITAYLDRETTKIDKAVTLTRQETDLLREYRKRLISDVVTGKVDVRNSAGARVEVVA